MSTTRRLAVVPAVALALGLLAACGSEPAGTAATTTGTVAATECPITVTDPWVKATDEEMTAAFGTVENSGDAEVVIVSATSPSAGMLEIHEVVDQDGTMVMQPKEGGLVVPAGGSATLAPGSDHLMLMALSAPIEAGAEVGLTLECADGSTASFTAVAKPFEGGEEDYEPGEGSDGMSSPSAS